MLKRTAARLFLALPLHGIFSREIEHLLSPLREEVPSVRWTEPRKVHVTLHFFGSVPTKEIEPIDFFSKRIASLFQPLQLELGKIGAFPSLERPDIIWLGILENTGRLLSLQRAIQGEVQSLGFKVETRPFQPHATIGRVKWKDKNLAEQLAKVPCGLPFPTGSADHFVLYQSHCLPEGTRYEVLKTYPLSKKA
ncbi:MAG: RNA 2',3'-cyclic phosphodiesterase [Candidatus Omnitrophota bacterium]